VTLSNGDTIEYTYDSFNRLIEEVNCAFNQRTIITYDKGGNIVEKSTARCNNGGSSTITFAYTNAWKDQLTSYNGQAITYDEIGNPTSYKGNTLYWTRGRLLDAYGNKACYTYNSAGIRVEKCVNGVPTKYVVVGSTIISETTNGVATVYYYSADGVIGFNRGGVDYFYRKNIQGDIIAILDDSGNVIAKYVYDAWGNHKIFDANNNLIFDSANPTTSTHIACINPYRYRGYYFDIETGLYYLQSRYYDPQVGRFLNADSIDYLAPENIQGLNLYSYCQNNPVMYVDLNGHDWSSFWNSIGAWFSQNWQKVVSIVEIAIGSVCMFIPSAQGVGSVLLNMGITSLVGGYANQSSGGSFDAGWYGGQMTGLLSKLPFMAGFAGGVTTGVIDKFGFGRDVSWKTIILSSIIAGGTNAIFSLAMPKISFGVSDVSDWFAIATAGYVTYASLVWSIRGFLSSAVTSRIDFY